MPQTPPQIANPGPGEAAPAALPVFDLGRTPYAAAYAEQLRWHERVLAAREGGERPSPGVVLLVEHPPVITVTRRASAAHLLADERTLAQQGLEVAQTDRGGDVTYHGPGQLVVYPILDLQALSGADGRGLKLIGYMRLLEQVVIDTIAQWGLVGVREPGAAGVWVSRDGPGREPAEGGGEGGGRGGELAKIAAMGVRIRRWVTMHGLALNVDPDMRHFQLIVPCGLAGRPVTSMRLLLGDAAPAMDAVKEALVGALNRRLKEYKTRYGAQR